ncbi:MAG TPA: YetF domain-containing protein [Acidimicrobiales bacterium]|nr:YetF domain-containing protein [Acidimicrobiales bacterium]
MFRWLLGDWRDVGFVAVSTALIYLSVVVGLRIGERRTLTEMTTYDFAVAIALGSIIGRTATSQQPSYVQGLTAVVVLLVCHHSLSILRTRSEFVHRIIDRSPIELVRGGRITTEGLRRAHMTRPDLEMVLREHGVRGLNDAELVMLEPRGAFSVIPRPSHTAHPGS